ncbi:MAG: substrate-binding domain-containing protein [Alphaproteobacteria bacterium]|nr:substrate-binding domain-containing protein [Alphaproteobacteria bacterium]
MFKKTLSAVVLTGVFAAGAAEARDQIHIVGSSTVFPFATTVAEHFGKNTKFKTPVIESTGSGGGLKLFCAGKGEGTPDITNSSSGIKKSQLADCEKNGIANITAIKIGYDGIVVANAKNGPDFQITLQDLFLALAKDIPDGKGGYMANDNMTWADVREGLPAIKIEVLGPPPTSGTRDAFTELAMEGGCKTFDDIAALKKSDKKAYKALCHTVREDGAYVEAGENDNLIVQKLEANPNALGVFGFSYLDQNADKLKGANVDGVDPEFENIASGKYPVSRSLWFYVKNDHVDMVPGIREFLAEFTSDKAWGPEGYMAEKGLIPSPAEERAKFAKAAKELANNVRDDVK